MNRQTFIFLLFSTLIFLLPQDSRALDQYVGDSTIYSASTEYLRPNVLFVVDNSAGMTQSGSREVYDPSNNYPGSYVTNKVYERKTATGGVINYVQYINDVTTDVSCSDAKTALQTTGYYAGELKKSDGSCSASQSGNYFLGNLLNYINTPTGAWQADTVYAVGDFIRRVDGGTHYIYQCTVGGTSGSTEPTWPTSTGATVTDGSVTWQVANPVWTASTAYEVGDFIRKTIDGTTYIFECTVAGTSGATEPTWPTTPGSTVEESVGGLTWSLPGDIIDMVKDTLAQVVQGARPSVNFGLMVFGDNNAGGKVLQPIQKLAVTDPDDPDTTPVDDGPTNYAALQTSIAGIALLNSNSQPVNELLHDAYYYFKGQNSSSSKIASDNVPHPYPIKYTCQKNFLIVLTTGATDTNNPKTRTIGDLNGDGNQGFIDDLTKFLYENDLNAGTTEDERIQTHIIQLLTPEVARLKTATDASHGRGDYFHVNNSNELTAALIDAMSNIVLESDTSFVAPVVPTSPENRTYSGERVYLGFFKPISQRPWYGNLKKYGIDHNNNIIDKNGAVATLSDGSFSASAVSFWGTTMDAGIVEEGGAGEILLSRNLATDPRKIYTNRGSYLDLTNTDNWFNSTNISAADLGVADDAARDSLINYINGYDSYDDDGDGTVGTPSNGEKRDWILGDILHSKPQIVNYNAYDFTTANESAVSGGGCTYNKTMIYVGTNDGMLHAFRDCDGREDWAFIPDNVLLDLKELAARPAKHTFFIDSSPAVYIYDKDNDGNIGQGPEEADGDADDGSDDKVILIFGQRRGGDAYYALNVTTPGSPGLLWKLDGTTDTDSDSVPDFAELGETWSAPQLGLVKYANGSTTEKKVVAFIGAGYDSDNEDGRFGSTQGFTNTDVGSTTTDSGDVASTATVTPDRDGNPYGLTNDPKGRGVYAFEIATLDASGVPTVASAPTKVWEFTYSSSSSGTLNYNRNRLMYSIPSEITVVDTDYDGFTDRLYVGDTGGQVWRISAYNPGSGSDAYLPYARSVINTSGDPWFGKRIFEANSASSNGASDKGRKFFYRPSITFEYNGVFNLYFGSGDRAHPLNTNVTDRLYGIFDKGQITSEEIDEDDLEDVTDNILQSASPGNDPETCTAGDKSTKCIMERLASGYGWYIKLDQNDGEKALASPLAFNKTAYYTTYAPNATASTDPCSPGNLGASRLYAVDYKTGEAVLNFNGTNDANAETATANNTRALSDEGKVLRRTDRSLGLGVGIPSGLVVVMPPSGDAKLLIGSGGGLISEDPVLGGTIIPIYWMQW